MLKLAVYKCEFLLSQNGRTWPCIVFSFELSAWLNPLFTNSVKITQVMNMEINQHGSPLWFGYNFWLLLRYFSSRNACQQTRLCIFLIQSNGEYKHHLWSLLYWYKVWTYYLPVHLLYALHETSAYMEFKNDIATNLDLQSLLFM
jgi:hypothetical protein